MNLPSFSTQNYLHTLFLGLIFAALGLFGLLAAYLYGRTTKVFKWREYLAMLILPLLFIVYLVFYVDRFLLLMFFASALIGFIAEGIVGLAYHQILGKRLWTYGRLSVNGYTSLLSIPLWGIAGIVFWFVSKLVGL